MCRAWFPNRLGTESVAAHLNLYGYELVIFLILASHGRAVLTDPGSVAFDPAAEREHQRLQEALRSHAEACEHRAALAAAGEDVLPPVPGPPPVRRRFCKKCTNFKPRHAHHCSICRRCILHMDHHCPWVNNCVGAHNLKHFLLFLIWTGVGSCYSICVTILRGVHELSAESGGGGHRGTGVRDAGGGKGLRQHRGGRPGHAVFPTTILLCVLSVILSLFFMVFVVAMLCEQYDNVASGGVGGIDALQNVANEGHKVGFFANAADAIGEPPGVTWRWFVPTAARQRRGEEGKMRRSASEKLV